MMRSLFWMCTMFGIVGHFPSTGMGIHAAEVGTVPEPVAELEHRDQVGLVAFAPTKHGKPLLATSSNGSLYFWDNSTGKCLAAEKNGGNARKLLFSSDGTKLAACTLNRVLIWDVSDLGKIRVINTLPWPDNKSIPQQILFSPDAKQLLIGAYPSGPVIEWNWNPKTEDHRVLCQIQKDLMGMAQVPGKKGKSNRLLLFTADGKLTSCSSTSGEDAHEMLLIERFLCVQDQSGLPPTPFGLAGGKKNEGTKFFITCYGSVADKNGAGLYIFKCREGLIEEKPQYFIPPTRTVWGSFGAISPDGKILVGVNVVDNKHELVFFDVSGKKPIELNHFAPNNGKPFSQVVFSPDGKWLATSAYQSRIVRLWDVAKVKRLSKN